MIRKYSPADSEAVVAISHRSPEAAQWSKDSYDQAVSSGQMVFLAEVARRVCGFLVARITSGEAEILNMAIDVSHRRHGIGSMLLTAAAVEGRSQHAQCMYLEVRESNHAAIAFYQKQGFCKTRKRLRYYQNPAEAAVLMEKKLTG